MRVRVESSFPICAGLFKPARVRRVAALDHNVHWYEFPQRELDTFLRSLYHHYAYNYHNDIRQAVQYQWYADLTLYYRGTTVMLTLSHSRLLHDPGYRFHFRESLNSEFGFYPSSIEFWEYDSANGFYMCHDVRKILNNLIRGVTR